MERIVQFNHIDYDPFIDFVKAYAIICVVIGHALPQALHNICLFYIYGSMQVPLFILVQTFHAYKKRSQPHFCLKKIGRRILLPFLILQVILISFLCITSTESLPNILIESLLGGGKGQGSYYPWVYIQIAILLPILYPLFHRFSMRQLLIPFIIICFGLDFFASVVNMPEWLYRLTAIRYLFLIYLGAIWINDGVTINKRTILLSFLTITATVFFRYTTINLEPCFFTTSWKTHRWICYFYVSNLLVYMLYLLYQFCMRSEKINKFVEEIGRSSYEIFLVQMAVFEILPPYIKHYITNPYISTIILIPLEIIFSIWLGIEFKQRVMVIFNRLK